MITGNRTRLLVLVLLMINGIVLAEGRSGRGEGMFGRKGEKGIHKGKGGHEAFIARLVRDRKLAAEVGLSEKQAQRIQEQLYKVRVKMVDLQADLQKAAMKQARLISAETIDEKALMTAVEETGRIRTKIAKLRIRPLLLLKSSLDPEQLRRARERMREHRQRRPRRNVSSSVEEETEQE